MSARLAYRTAVGAAAGAALLAACSGGGSGASGTHAGAPAQAAVTATAGPDGVQRATVVANAKYRFVPSTVNVTTGKVELTLRVQGSTPHNLTLDALHTQTPTTSAGHDTRLDFTANSPGKYQFVCTFHESLGQTGTLVVAAR